MQASRGGAGGLQGEPLAPTLQEYNATIAACATAHRWARALRLLGQIAVSVYARCRVSACPRVLAQTRACVRVRARMCYVQEREGFSVTKA